MKMVMSPVTLFHWDYPEKLMKRGGWLNRECIDWFAEYTRVVVEHLSDRVNHWLTINEPLCFVELGYEEGVHAPCMRVGRRYAFDVAHNMLLTHGKAVQTIRTYAKKKPLIGFAPALNYVMPDSSATEYIEQHLKNVHRAISEGVDIIGYMYWSFMDNFEWNNGYRKRFGLIYVDYMTQQRIWKDSAHRYKEIIATNGTCLLN